MAFYEFEESNKYLPIPQRKPFNYWDKVWIAIENKTFRPIQETKLWFDVLNTLDSYSIYINNENVIIWDKLNLKMFISHTPESQALSCLEIRKAWIIESAYYYINPLLNSNLRIPKIPLKVYCDMENDWGWWTRLYYKDWKETCFNEKHYYNSFIIEKIFTKDFAVSDTLETIKSEWSWILKDVDFSHKNFDFIKMANVANCTTPIWTWWTSDYSEGHLTIAWTLLTMWNWKSMFYGCWFEKKLTDKISFRIWWWEKHNWEFIHWSCNDYTEKDNSITSRWDWNNTRVIWVR